MSVPKCVSLALNVQASETGAPGALLPLQSQPEGRVGIGLPCTLSLLNITDSRVVPERQVGGKTASKPKTKHHHCPGGNTIESRPPLSL